MSSFALNLSANVKLSTGYTMPRLGFGVYQNYDARTSVAEALKVGYRLIDTAQAYKNEAHVGDAIREATADIPRSEVFLTTKVAPKCHGYENTLKSIDGSLAALQTDYVDLFLIHDPFGGPDARKARYTALLQGQKDKKIRSVGVSNFGVKHLQELSDANLPLPSVNQIELHPFCQQKPIVQYCIEHNIALQAYCPIVRGKGFENDTVASLASKHSKEPAQVLLRWSLQKGFVPLPKSEQPSRILSNSNLYDFELSEEDMQALDALDEGKEGSISWNPVDTE